MNIPLLSFKKVQLKIPSKEKPILDDLSFDVFAGDFIILLGGNGSGKSSLIKIMNGLAIPTEGELVFKGRSLLRRSIHQRAQEVTTLTQDLSLSTFSDLTVFENCLMAFHRNKPLFSFFSRKVQRDKVVEYLRSYSHALCSKLDEPISSLSGGERQALALAMSLWTTPQLLLLDEHTSALDPRMAHKVMHLTSQLIALKKITAIAATHNLQDALTYGNRIIAMQQGKIVLDLKDKTQVNQERLLSIYFSNV
jgi:putative tryptophan/tyrosine transport system ATP-binding protein